MFSEGKRRNSSVVMKVYLLSEGSQTMPGGELIIVGIYKTMEGALRGKAELEATPQTRYDGSIYYLKGNDIEEWELKE